MSRNLPRAWAWIKYFIAMIAVIYTLFSVHNAEAITTGKPSIYSQGSADTTKVDKGVTEMINLSLYLSLGAGAIAISVGIFMLTPIIGKPEKGQQIIKGGAVVIVLAGLFKIILNFFGGLFI